MYQDIKNGYARVKRFVEEHPTVSACTATAVVSWKMSKRHTLKGFGDDIGKLTELVYQWGNENGVLQLQNTVLLDFINENGLGDQVREFIQEHVAVETV
jgi:hypothetical protein